MKAQQVNIAILASGKATNARNIVQHFKDNNHIKVALLMSNRADSGVPSIAAEHGIPFYIFNRNELYHSEKIIQILLAHDIHVIVLAGFLWLVPPSLIRLYRGRMLNIHPALLPAHGGKGMYGMNVHKAVKQNGDTRTGITIHLVDEEYDKGPVLFQAATQVLETDTPEDIAQKVHQLEYRHFPEQVERFVRQTFHI